MMIEKKYKITCQKTKSSPASNRTRNNSLEESCDIYFTTGPKKLTEGIEPSSDDYKSTVMPLYYASQLLAKLH